jgi:4-alpha-glucanotransferase
MTSSLRELARAWGLQAGYRDMDHRPVTTSTVSTVAVLRALGAPLDDVGDAADALRERRAQLAARVVEPVLVAWEGVLDEVVVRPRTADRLRLGVALEGEDEPAGWVTTVASPAGKPVAVPMRARLPHGYHRLVVASRSRREDALVIAAPRRAPAPVGRTWGVFAPSYALRSSDDWGVGGFRELGALVAWVRERGGSLVATLPMLAQFLDGPVFEPGPYAPASRLFWNELFLDVERLPELDASPEARAALEDPDLRREVKQLRATPLVEYRRAMAAKRRVLGPLAERVLAAPPHPFREFVSSRPEVREYARFRQEVERRGEWWGVWPSPERGGELAGDPHDDPSGRYHLYVQWAAERQLRDLAPDRSGLALDLPLGVHPAGFDAWRWRHVFLDGVSVGAPPDPLFSGGQEWGFRPLHPDRIREDGYRYPIACVRHLLRNASLLRLDHVMGLHRVYCVPKGMPSTAGVYVGFRPDEWYAMLSLEAHRAGAVIIGEDLGTVPAYVRRAMRSHRLLGMFVAELEVDPAGRQLLPDPPPTTIATVATHDMPPFARFWAEADARIKEAIASFLAERGYLAPRLGADPRAVLDGCLAFLAASPAPVVIATLEDLWLETRPQNVPGTGSERPNWRVRMRHTVEELDDLEDARRTLDRIATLREEARR